MNEIFERPAVVVGVDGSERNEAAVAFATAEAVASGRSLLLVTAVEARGPTKEAAVTDHYDAMLSDLSDRIAAQHDGLVVRTAVRTGHPVGTLLSSTEEGDLLVVGKRGLGTIRRLLVGSTSIRCAAQAELPLIVVPAEWDAEKHATGPVVVGIDPEKKHDEPLRFAFQRAQRSGTPVRVVYAVDMDLVIVVGAGAVKSSDVHDWEGRSVAAVEEAIKPLREEFPDVEVDIVHERSHAATVLLDRSADAQLAVVARHHHGPAGSWGLGSVAREVLHDAKLPVAVIPQ